ncbi:MAG: ribosome assembly factor SBDS [Desulfurococcales archaeon]|nr:ribosome assembly factor SBDS [Desulfurococcales archaeon]
MPRKHDYVVAWIVIKGKRFEILVRPDPAFKFKEGEKVSIDDILWTDTVYRDARKGLKASPEEVKKAFGTEDIRVIAEKILKEGEIQLTEEQRRKLIEAKKRQIITYIAKNAIDPKTGKPIPEKRIETAFEQLRIGVDPFKDAESQAIEAVKKISTIMPIKLAKAVIRAVIPPQYSGRLYREIQRLGRVLKTEWLNDGSLRVELEVPAGSQVDVVQRIQGLTRGSARVEVKVVKS